MSDVGWGALIALVVGLFGLFIKGKNSEQPKPEPTVEDIAEAKEIMDDHVEEVAKAGTDYTNSMAMPVDDRVRDILSKFRKRTNK